MRRSRRRIDAHQHKQPDDNDKPHSSSSNMRIHQSELYHMRGSGVGSIFSTIFRRLIPIASNMFGFGKQVLQTKTGQKVLQAVKRPALQAGLDIARDALDGENVVKSIKKRGRQAGQQAMENVLTGKGGKKAIGAGGRGGSVSKARGKKRKQPKKKQTGGGSGAKRQKRGKSSGGSSMPSLMSELGL